jgi:hypothetical protein
LVNCKSTSAQNSTGHIRPQSRGVYGELIGHEYAINTTVPDELVNGSLTLAAGTLRFIGCDLSAMTNALVSLALVSWLDVQFWNCKLGSGVSLVTGAAADRRFRIENHYSEVDGTAKTSGQSRQNLEIQTSEGEIVEETTAVRTGGASDGATGAFSHAYTPTANDTRDNYLPLVGPWMYIWIAGDGTSKTLTVYIANSGAGDYQDDEVYLEVLYPSEAGGAQHAHKSNQMGLLGTAANVTDDTTSTWGTGANNPQKLQLTVAPDYEGPLYCRVHFAKNFAASPETLYVDPLPEAA